MTELPHSHRPQWEIFCQVVDNFGDIGVCWRLARALAREFGDSVRLWVDDPDVLARICPEFVVNGKPSKIAGVEVLHWPDPFPELEPGEVVIEAFACELPEKHVRAMARQAVAPVWINLEYLSAEDWVAGCHGLASPHPSLPLTKHFFFPGFDDATGGLLRESGLIAARDAFRAGGGRAALLTGLGIRPPTDDTLVASLFAYEQSALHGLVNAWAQGPRPLLLLVPEGRVLGDLARACGRAALAAGDRLQLGRLEVAVLPFTDQPGYDRLLWACDLNFVRGEDSFVRAQWAGRPFVWQIYVQQDDAHLDKLEAFLARYCAGLDAASAQALRAFWAAWNGRGDAVAAWADLLAALPAIDVGAQRWCEALAGRPDLAVRLKQFCNHISRRAG